MINSILFLISSILVIINFLLIKKSNTKLNPIKWICISLILMFCLNSIIVYILSYIRIPSKLIILSIIYISIALFIYFKYLKKEKQQYSFDKKVLFPPLIIILVVLFIAYIRFGLPISIKYHTFDPGLHFQSAYSFYEESILLNFAQGKTILNFETWRFASYTNLGIIFKFFSPFINANNFYNIYILYDIFTLFITAILFYYLVDNGKNNIVKMIGTIFFLTGYPLNNLLIGFFYVGHASCIIMTILLIIKELNNEKLKFPLLFILNTGVMFTYYLFIPFLYAAEFLYFIKTKQIIKKYIFLFLIPLVLGFLYFILPTFSNSNMNLGHQIKIDGYFYNDVISNSLLFLPIISYSIYCSIKEKKFEIETIMTICLIALMILLNILMLSGIIMPYYASKYYYILWILCFVVLFKMYDKYYYNNKFAFNNYLLFIIFTIVFTITNIENTIINLNEGDWNKTTPSKLFDVYSYNIELIKNPRTIFTADELEDIKEAALNIDSSFITNTEPERIMWLINFINSDKINCPVNQLYDCLKELYYLDLEDYLNNSNNFNGSSKEYIFFTRSIYWNSNLDLSDIPGLSSNNLNKIKKFNFGFILGSD